MLCSSLAKLRIIFQMTTTKIADVATQFGGGYELPYLRDFSCNRGKSRKAESLQLCSRTPNSHL
jgi:hypothetical protein